jgi:hypothetical protein
MPIIGNNKVCRTVDEQSPAFAGLCFLDLPLFGQSRPSRLQWKMAGSGDEPAISILEGLTT